tara:strand:- start:380 stop:1282 length:903 start_codon:yes stop_codon:yes gene_type:complete
MAVFLKGDRKTGGTDVRAALKTIGLGTAGALGAAASAPIVTAGGRAVLGGAYTYGGKALTGAYGVGKGVVGLAQGNLPSLGTDFKIGNPGKGMGSGGFNIQSYGQPDIRLSSAGNSTYSTYKNPIGPDRPRASVSLRGRGVVKVSPGYPSTAGKKANARAIASIIKRTEAVTAKNTAQTTIGQKLKASYNREAFNKGVKAVEQLEIKDGVRAARKSGQKFVGSSSFKKTFEVAAKQGSKKVLKKAIIGGAAGLAGVIGAPAIAAGLATAGTAYTLYEVGTGAVNIIKRKKSSGGTKRVKY